MPVRSLAKLLSIVIIAGIILTACSGPSPKAPAAGNQSNPALSGQVGGGAPPATSSLEHGQPPAELLPTITIFPGQEGGGGPTLPAAQSAPANGPAQGNGSAPNSGAGVAQQSGGAGSSSASAGCPATLFSPERPPEPAAGAYPAAGWYKNNDGSLWGGVLSTGGLRSGLDEFVWIKPEGSQLEISGSRLDLMAPPLGVDLLPGGSGASQESTLTFPSGGCWQISARAGSSSLQFTVFVNP